MVHTLAGSGFRRAARVSSLHAVTDALQNSLVEAALRTAQLIRAEAEIAQHQTALARRRAAACRAVAEAERAEALLHLQPVHAAPREQRVKLLEDQARVIDSEAEVFDREAERLLSQARTAEQRARNNGS